MFFLNTILFLLHRWKISLIPPDIVDMFLICLALFASFYMIVGSACLFQLSVLYAFFTYFDEVLESLL